MSTNLIHRLRNTVHRKTQSLNSQSVREEEKKKQNSSVTKRTKQNIKVEKYIQKKKINHETNFRKPQVIDKAKLQK